MRKLLLFFSFHIFVLTAAAQPTGLFDETFNLKFIMTNTTFYTPNGENSNITFFDNGGNYSAEAAGILNTLNAEASFSGNSVTLSGASITLLDCVEPNCYYENIYFYDILTTQNLDPKTFTYHYNESAGIKYLRVTDADNNRAFYSTAPPEVANPLLSQTWYLYMTEVDLGDPTFYGGPNPPQITIHPDFSFTGIEDCALISGDFILGNGDDFSDFILQARNYQIDESNCTPGPVIYAMPELSSNIPLGSVVYHGNDGNDYFSYETFPGFISHYRNTILATPENSLADFQIYPNPAKNKLLINSADFVTSVLISDNNGRKVFLSEGESIGEVDISSLSAGIYFLTLSTSEANVTKKFIKN